ncbi:hypothetical protein [Deminuibacter soli]|nr:hypothetical protein [Deminuibacter soli]
MIGSATDAPKTMLEVRKGIEEYEGAKGTLFTAPLFIGHSNDIGAGSPAEYLLLVPALITSTTGNNCAGMNGTLTFYRGNGGALNSATDYHVNIQSAYSNTYANLIPLSETSPVLTLYTVKYLGNDWLAVKMRDINGSGAAINFSGYWWNAIADGQLPRLVQESGVSNSTIFKSYQSVASNIMYASPAGSISIGTADAAAGYKLAVDGAALFTKAVVKARQSWPDYVFDSTYQLPHLDSVAAYIQQNKHLPEVPSAAEVQQHGVDLAANQAVLLKKMEELTLYMIDMKKQNDQLMQKNRELEQKMQQLQSEIKNK